MSKQQKNSAFVKMLKEFPKVFGRVSFRERLMLRTAFDYINEEVIADIKANCDYILEGKEIEYREERNKLCADFENMKAGLESKIAELEKENAELKKKLKEKLKSIADKDLSFVAKYDALENENADLKKQIEEYKNGNFVQTVNQIIEGKDKQLEQAKKIIKGLLSC